MISKGELGFWLGLVGEISFVQQDCLTFFLLPKLTTIALNQIVAIGT